MSLPLNQKPMTFFIFGALLMVGVGCSNKQPALEQELCNLYKKVKEKNLESVSSREGALAESIQAEMPAFFDEHYVNLVQVDWSKRARTLDRLFSALDDSRSKGLCPPILAYYQQ